MQSGQRFVTRLETANKYSVDDEKWAAFVRDHKQYLIDNSTKQDFIPEGLVKYKFRPQDFVVEVCQCPVSMTWIFMFINDLRDPADFNESCKYFYIPNSGIISTLYSVCHSSVNYSVE